VNASSPDIRHLVILDFEATCDGETPPVPQEIIEFPSVFIDLERREVVDEFSSFVRPVAHPVLTPFCTRLTSIRQQDVETAPIFVDVLDSHIAWLEGHDLLSKGRLVTCGDWDLSKMLPSQCAAVARNHDELPEIYRQWVNIKRVFADVRGIRKKIGMPGMLRELGLELIGTHHRGIDDCRNLARIALALADAGADFELTSPLM
jgi:inhibitor of KinA sporulation pathway (predicted exonuclease)